MVGFVLRGWDVTDQFEQSPVVEPVDVSEGRVFDVVEDPPPTAGSGGAPRSCVAPDPQGAPLSCRGRWSGSAGRGEHPPVPDPASVDAWCSWRSGSLPG